MVTALSFGQGVVGSNPAAAQPKICVEKCPQGLLLAWFGEVPLGAAPSVGKVLAAPLLGMLMLLPKLSHPEAKLVMSCLHNGG